MNNSLKSSKWKAFGPGILFAGSAVGTSHLVQSTRAGADFSMGLALIFILVAVLKYPATRFGKDYSTSTGKSLIHNYASYGWPILLFYVIIVAMSLAFVSAALAMVNASILTASLPINIPIRWLAILALIVSAIMLITGQYKFLEKLNKFLVPAFTILILVTTIVVAFKADYGQLNWSLPPLNTATLIYIVSIAGWLLTPMDASIFLSLWTVEKSKVDAFDKRNGNLDFNIGYWGSLLLALCFLFLGASLLNGAGDALPKQGGAFITEIIGLFSNALGNWSFPVICFIAFTVMYSTLVTVMDGYARNVEAICDLNIGIGWSRNYQVGVLIVTMASCLVILLFMSSFTVFIDLVGVLVFVLGPVYAVLNHRAVFGRDVPLSEKPSKLIKFVSWSGIVVMSIVAIFYIILRWYI